MARRDRSGESDRSRWHRASQSFEGQGREGLTVQSLSSNGLVYAPVKFWSEDLITQASVFPKGKHDDLVDKPDSGAEALARCRCGAGR
jgi:phage terminase large subunit-like protein